MKAKNEVVRTIKLELTEQEAAWLKSHLQNPLHGETPEEEPEDDRKMRKIFWDALNLSR